MTATGALRHYVQPILFAPDQIEAAVRLGPAHHGAASAAASAADRAAEPLARFAAWARAVGQPWALAVLHRCQALTGDGDPEAHYREALRQHAVSGRPFEHGRTELLYGEWLRRDRRGMDARAHLRIALALFERTGAAPWAERARAELRAAGEPAAAGAPAPDRLSLLTPQEFQVVRLAAFGATNRDIAAQLFTHQPWWLVPAVILVPDLFMLGYLRDTRVGAAVYNLGHSYLLPAAMSLAGAVGHHPLTLALGLLWLAHIGMDRLARYGLKYDVSFQHTHLGGPR